MKISQKIFFPNLDGLRFIAFFAVFFYQSSIISCLNTDPTSAFYQFAFAQKMNGALGVNLFFVLSGFLITYLLLSEKEKYGRINVPHFYMRRLLRIWPLYYLMIIAGFLLFPYVKHLLGIISTETHSPGYYLFFISNFEMIQKGFADSSILNVLWSVGVEEQFYLAWPILLFFIPTKHLLKFFAVMLAATLFFRFYHSNNNNVIYYHTLSVIGDMFLGGMVAWMAFSKPAFIKFLASLSKATILLVYAIGIIIILFDYKLFSNQHLIFVQRLVYGLFFAFVIAEQNFATNSFFKISNNKFLSKWGNYTYGLYCLHTIGLLIAHFISERIIKSHNNWFIMLFDFTVGLGLSMILAYYSYHYFEAPFLRWKNKFAFFTK
ncbi:MAG: acyltransferase [Chitinophagaceae bacterium]